MRKRFAFYCSGGAGTVRKFYRLNNLNDYPVQFIFYDGERIEIESELNQLEEVEIISFQNSGGLKGRHLSQRVSDLLLDALERHKIDYLFVFGEKILKPPLVNTYKNRIINFHPSLLPAFPGAMPIDKALKSSTKLLGNTAHFIDEGVDTGPIIMQCVMARDHFKSYDDVLDMQQIMLTRIWQLVDNDKIWVEDGKVVVDEKPSDQIFFTF